MIAERYVLLEQIGSGGFATTYRGHDRVLDRPVAIKILHASFAADPDDSRRFEQEAQAAAAISHPNVVQVYDVARSDGIPVIVLQYVAGRDLRRVLRDEGLLAPAVAVGLVLQTLAGLAAVHRAGIIHRDIKPENILLGHDGVVRLTDFGIARQAGSLTMTQPGTVFGTAGYIAPEQALGRAVSQATDLYAMGVVLFELVTGRLPFTGDSSLAVMMAHVEQSPPRASSLRADGTISPALDAVIARALAKEPTARFPNATAMAAALTAAVPDGAATSDQLATQPLATTSATAPLPSTAAAAGPPRNAVPQARAAGSGRDRRRRGSWRIPVLILVAVALGLVLVAADHFRGSEGPTPTRVPALVTTITPTAGLTAPTATAPLIAPIATDVPTAAPTNPPTPTATVTPLPTATATATATATVAPTATPPVATAPIQPGTGPQIVPVTPVVSKQPAMRPAVNSQPGHGHGKAKGHDKGDKDKDKGPGK